jgi:hypothetical protein
VTDIDIDSSGQVTDKKMRRSKFIFASAILMPPTFRLAVFASSGQNFTNFFSRFPCLRHFGGDPRFRYLGCNRTGVQDRVPTGYPIVTKSRSIIFVLTQSLRSIITTGAF